MEPKPVITYFGEKEIFGPVLQKKLHTRLSQLQHLVAPKLVVLALKGLDLLFLLVCIK